KDGRNGVIFRDRDVQDLTVKVSGLLREPENIAVLGRGAYETVSTEWNADEAAVRFVRLSEALNKGEYSGSLWEDGPGSIDTIA
ncbi:MAG: glycosyltransferase, partial [Synergistaceae bacterium]|nr:glycosyltransferase [Synergistaceae bacterium]